jgi:hypothetical protein
MITGSSPCDDGNLIIDNNEKEKLVDEDKRIEPYLKKYVGAQELINNTFRYCIYVTEDLKEEAFNINSLSTRFEKVKIFRSKSKKEATKKKSETSYLFDEDRYQKQSFILVPKVGSERRKYLPIGFYDENYLPSNTTKVIYNSKIWLYSILSSKMQIVWVRVVAGRLKTDMQYSNTLCYNTFPFPSVSNQHIEELTKCAFRILEEREKHPEKTLAELYDPDKMPEGLKEAHRLNDEAVERCYRSTPFNSDEERLEYLFKLYEKMVHEEKEKGTLFEAEKKTRKKK